MRCPACVKEGRQHNVAYVASYPTDRDSVAFPKLKTVIRFWDKNDVYHEHDPNSYTIKYMCSKHKIRVTNTRHCLVPDCDFGKENETVVVEDKDRANEDH